MRGISCVLGVAVADVQQSLRAWNAWPDAPSACAANGQSS